MPRPWWTYDASENVRPNTKGVCDAVKKLCVICVSATAWRPVFENRDGEAATHARRHICRELFSPGKSRELEPLKIEGVAEGVLADSCTASPGNATVERATVTEPTRCAPVMFDGQLGDETLETGQARYEGAVHTSGPTVTDLVAAIPDERSRVAIRPPWTFRDALDGVEFIGIWRPTGEETEEADVLAARHRCAEHQSTKSHPAESVHLLHHADKQTSRPGKSSSVGLIA